MSQNFTQEYWNNEAGDRWVRSHTRLDELMKPYAEKLLERADLSPGMRVVDVGCGAGAMALAAATICGPGRVRGVDISAPLLGLAKRLANDGDHEVSFIEHDATHWSPDEAVDRVISRFGVMFFEDPPRAFRNIRSWLAPDGRFVAVCWQSRAANPWIFKPVEILTAHMEQPVEDESGPGPHSLAEPDHVRSLLSDAGFDRVEVKDLTVTTRLDGDVDQVCAFYLDWGPSGRLYENAPKPAQLEIADRIREYVADRHDGSGMDLVGRAWLVDAA